MQPRPDRHFALALGCLAAVLLYATDGGTAPGRLVFPAADAQVTRDVGTEGNVKYGNLVDPGDESGWTLQNVPAGVYRVLVDVRTGSRGEGTDFIASYRLVAPAAAFPNGATPGEIGFIRDPAEPLTIAGRGKGYLVWRGYIRAKRLLRLRSRDVLKLHSSAHYAHVWNLRLERVADRDLQEVRAAAEPVANLFPAGEPVRLNVAVTNWRTRAARLALSCRVNDLANETLFAANRELAVAAQTETTVTVVPRRLRFGPLTARFELRGAGGAEAGCHLEFALSPAPAPDEVGDESLFGLHKAGVRDWPVVGAKWDRLWDTGDTWNRIEKEPGVFNWSALDRKVHDAETHGVRLLYVFAYTPTWASSRPQEPHYTGGGARAPAKDLADWTRFIRAVVTRYRGKLDHFEVWNEPNAGFFTGTPEDYVRLLKAAYETAKQANPDCTILGISGTGSYLKWMEQVCRLGGLKYMDGVSVHTYTTPNSPEAANVSGRYRATWTLIKKYAPPGRTYELWNTETGVWVPDRENGRPLTQTEIDAKAPPGTAPNWKPGWPYRPVDELTAAHHLVSHYVLAAAAGVRHLFWYAWYAQSFPMYTVEGAPRYHTLALAGLSAELSGARYVRRVDVGAPTVHVHLFSTTNDLVAACWTLERKPVRLLLDTAAAHPTLVDLWGNERQVETTNGLLTLTLTRAAGYLHGVPLSDFATLRLAEPETTAKSQRVGMVRCPRAREDLSLHWSPGQRKQAVRLTLDTRRQAVLGVADPFASTSEADAWKGPVDSSAVVETLWDDHWLGVRAAVTDDKLVPAAAGQGAYNGDGIEVFLDFRRGDRLGSPEPGDGVRQLLCGLPPTPGAPPVRQGAWPAGSQVSVQRKATGYVVTLLLPWKALLAAAPRPGLTFGFDVAIDDADVVRAGKAVRKAQLVWHGTANDFQDPSVYGRLQLGE